MAIQGSTTNLTGVGIAHHRARSQHAAVVRGLDERNAAMQTTLAELSAALASERASLAASGGLLVTAQVGAPTLNKPPHPFGAHPSVL